MPDFPFRNIQQQMYTRERRGVFRSAEGFDTVARSSGLEPSYIKKVLHPFCQYEAPAELTARSEKDAEAYPAALHLFHTETGETVLGRSVFQPADFTGLRSAFFTHHYVIPDGFLEDEHSAYRTWLQASFANHYDIEEGIELPELSAMPAQARPQVPVSPDQTPALLQELGIDEKVFKQLLYASITAAAGKKKVYIVLDVPVEQLSAKAKQLLFVLFGRLPYALRRVLGFVTYAKEPYSKKGLHLMFVEKGGLRLNDRNIEKDYLFELAAGRVINADLKWSEQPYLDFAWDTVLDLARSERFFAFAEQMLSDMEPARQISLDSYDDLCVLFQIEEGREDLYNDHKFAVLRALLLYLEPAGALGLKKRLDDLFLALFAHEFELVKGGQVPDPAIAGSVKDYHSINPRQHNDMIVEYFIRSLNNALSKQRQDVTLAIYGLLEGSPALSRAFYARVLTSPGLPALMFDPYMKASMKQRATPTDLVDLISLWVRNHPLLLEQENYVRLAEAQLIDKLQHDADPVRAVNAVLDQLDSLEHHEERGIARYQGGTAFADRMIYAANLFLLRELEPEQLNRKQLLDIGFLQMPKEFKGWVERFDSRIRSKAAVMLALYQWCSRTEVKAEVLADLSTEERERTQHIMRRWLQQDVAPSHFESITLAFCTEIHSGAIDYRGLLDYVHKYSKSPEVVYQYIQWSAKQPVFVKPRGLVPAYAAAIVQYFKTHDREAFKNKEYVKTYFSNPDPVLKGVYTKVRAELASPFMRFIRSHPRFVKIASAALVLILAGGIFLMVQNGKDPADPNSVVTPPVTVPPVSEDTVPEQPLLTASVVEEGEQKGLTELSFHFKQSAACRDFNMENLQVLGQDANLLFEAASPELSRTCTDETTGGADTDPTGTDSGSSQDQTDSNSGTTAGDAEGAGSDSSESVDGGEEPEFSGTENDSQQNLPYTSKVIVKLDKTLDVSLIDKVVVDGISYELSDESALSEEQTPENGTSERNESSENESGSGN
ncbi:hypothetical protein C7121_10090 [Paenibacillus glucanolyticus]|uniref:GAP1-N2 domain-containing protein n=1 Tax=Paenibacillus TaxID=44249 RepID=UPI0003E26D4C|nr:MULTISPECIES: hypothetical protein [Paenibacillus]ANA79598.1 hypothetical protein A3958_06205 [Paenibacillus glucanolyticus]AVV56453.1 hypothetical protein C7121_10090 [Paenibacillus glucanolyticus]ETT31279.1 hypothetical protein C169_25588 [Paenibacillus sp. FSL R5-808]